MSNLKFTVSRFYAEVTPESGIVGEYSKTGSIYDNRIMSFKELISEIEDFTDMYIDDNETGTERQETLHITECTGTLLTSRQLYKIYKTAGLIK